MGIIGKTHGVKRAARPNPNAVKRNGNRAALGSGLRVGVCAAVWDCAPGVRTSAYPGGMAKLPALAPGLKSICVAAAFRTGLRHLVSEQAWYRAVASTVALPVADGLVSASIKK